MTADVYDAWRTAGDWVLAYWPWLGGAGVVLAAVVAVAWAFGRDDYRSRNDRQQALMRIHLDRPEPPAPGSNEQWLATCREIYAADTDTATKED